MKSTLVILLCFALFACNKLNTVNEKKIVLPEGTESLIFSKNSVELSPSEELVDSFLRYCNAHKKFWELIDIDLKQNSTAENYKTFDRAAWDKISWEVYIPHYSFDAKNATVIDTSTNALDYLKPEQQKFELLGYYEGKPLVLFEAGALPSGHKFGTPFWIHMSTLCGYNLKTVELMEYANSKAANNQLIGIDVGPSSFYAYVKNNKLYAIQGGRFKKVLNNAEVIQRFNAEIKFKKDNFGKEVYR